MKKKKKAEKHPLYLVGVLLLAAFTFLLRRNWEMVPMLSALLALVLVFVFYLLGSSVLRDEKKAFFAVLVLLTMHGLLQVGRDAQYLLPLGGTALGLCSAWLLILSFEDNGRLYAPLAALAGGLGFLLGGFPVCLGLVLPFLVAYLLVWRPSFKGKAWVLPLYFLLGVLVWALYVLWLVYFDGLHWPEALQMWHLPKFAIGLSHWWSLALALGLWAVPDLLAWLSPLYSEAERKSVEFRCVALWTLLALGVDLLFSAANPLPSSLIPAALLLSCALVSWEESATLRGKKRQRRYELHILLLLMALALSLSLIWRFYQLWSQHHEGMTPAVIGILGVSTLAIVVYLISSVFRRSSTDLAIGVALFALISEILLPPVYWML